MNDQLKLGTRSGQRLLTVRVQPRSSQNKISGTHQGALKVSLTAPPVDNRANLQFLRFLAHYLRLPTRNLSLLQGGRSRSKVVVLDGLSEA